MPRRDDVHVSGDQCQCGMFAWYYAGGRRFEYLPSRLERANWVEVGGSAGGGGGGPLIADHQGIDGSCSGTPGTSSVTCTYTKNVLCSTTAGSNQYTISGYTPTSGDVNKVLVIGMAYDFLKAPGGSTVGAGGSSYAGQPLVVKIGGVSGQTITGTTLAGGSSSANAANSVTNAECDLGTDNNPLLATALVSGNATIPAGSYMVASPMQIPNGRTITCQAGAKIVDPRYDNYVGQFFNGGAWYFQNATSGGVNGCTIIGTNTYGGYPTGSWPNADHMLYFLDSSNITIQNVTTMFRWEDSAIELNNTTGGGGSNNNIVTNIIAYVGAYYGPSIIAGHNNTFSNITGIDNGGFDLEPNNDAQAGLTHDNSVTNSTWIADGNFNHVQYNWSSGAISFCLNNTACLNGQTITGNHFIGPNVVFSACSGNVIHGTWSGNTATANGAGSPNCQCDSQCW